MFLNINASPSLFARIYFMWRVPSGHWAIMVHKRFMFFRAKNKVHILLSLLITVLLTIYTNSVSAFLCPPCIQYVPCQILQASLRPLK